MPRHSEPIRRVVHADGTERWVVRVSETRKGKRTKIQKTVATYEEAVQVHARSQLGERTIQRRRDDFDHWAERYLADRAKRVRDKTVADYAAELTRPRKHLGDLLMQDIEEEDIEVIVDEMASEGLAKATVARMLTRVRAVMSLAIKSRVIPIDPAADVEARGAASGQRDALTLKEATLVREAVRGDRHEAYWLLVLTGLRRSEVLALQWDDIDLQSGTLTISRSRTQKGGVNAPKTSLGYRTVALTSDRVTALRELRAWQAETYGLAQAKDGYIVVNEAGKPMRPEDMTARWKALCEATDGVRDHVLHAARHTSVTLMRNAGVPDHVVAKHHGHDEVVMARTYSHAHLDDLRQAAEALPI